MKKKYSDPLLFASFMLTGPIVIEISDEGEMPSNVRATKSVFSVNSAAIAPASEDPVTIVNPVEEAVTNASTGVTAGVTSESSAEAVSETTTTSPLEVESIIDEIVPEVTEEAATAGTTTY